MVENLPSYITYLFGLTAFVTLILFHLVLKNSSDKTIILNANKITLGIVIWMIIQAILSYQNIYNTNLNAIPPKIFLLGVIPTLIIISAIFFSQKGKKFVDKLSLKSITYLNIVRFPVEIVLWWLFLNKAVPQLMTFEGYNFDILAGITAPFLAYFVFTKKLLSRKVLLIWNCLCLLLLLNIVTIAFLSAPSPLQKLAFKQPNIAILNYPFSLLATFIVPIILFGHLVSIRQLLKVTLKEN
jgi:hypothetical protein